MIDTAHVTYKKKIEPDQLRLPWCRNTAEKPDGNENVWYRRREIYRNTFFLAKYTPLDYTGNPSLSIQITSLPRLVYGDNITLLKSIDESFSVLNDFLKFLLPGSDIDVGQGIPSRVDFLVDYYVGKYVSDYLQAICQLIYPHRRRQPYSNPIHGRSKNLNNGVTFYSKEIQCSFYNKYLQSQNPKALGVLRHELSINGTNQICRAVGLPILYLADITQAMANKLLIQDLIRLGLYDTYLVGQSLILEKLKEYYPTSKAQHLKTVCREIQENPNMEKQELADFLGIQSRTLNMNIRDIQTAGIVPGMLDERIQLPPLNTFFPK